MPREARLVKTASKSGTPVSRWITFRPGDLFAMSRAELRVFEELHVRLRPGQRLQLSKREFADQFGCCHRTVQRGICGLERRGYISCVREEGAWTMTVELLRNPG